MVGLGNPGSRYANTRHNLGADVAVLLAERFGERLRDDTKVSASVAEIRIGDKRVVVAVPMTWMNESGKAVSSLLRRYDLPGVSSLVVLHDELDLPTGRVKVKSGGGLAGNNGLRSIHQHLGTKDFTRVRLGVDKPPGGSERGADWVLAKIPRSARVDFDIACQRAADAVELIAVGGPEHAMQKINASDQG
ncbi:MAG: aminoacyl-tRNA hydrolase [Microthrixaceae bacterium]